VSEQAFKTGELWASLCDAISEAVQQSSCKCPADAGLMSADYAITALDMLQQHVSGCTGSSTPPSGATALPLVQAAPTDAANLRDTIKHAANISTPWWVVYCTTFQLVRRLRVFSEKTLPEGEKQLRRKLKKKQKAAQKAAAQRAASADGDATAAPGDDADPEPVGLHLEINSAALERVAGGWSTSWQAARVQQARSPS
jgi:hypothetical protein